MTNEQIKDLVVECFDLGPEDIDAVLAFMCKLEDMRPEHDQHLSDEAYIEAKAERFRRSEWGKMTSEEIDKMLNDLRS